MILLVLLLHILLIVLTLVLRVLQVIKFHLSVLALLVLVPVFGPIAILIMGLLMRMGYIAEPTDVPSFKIEKEIYRAMGMMNDDEEDVVSLEDALALDNSEVKRNLMLEVVRDTVVPLEDALTISSNDTRRKLMMDILNSDISAFYELMEKAKLNDDVEVVHYATTAMAELNKQYDGRLSAYENLYEEKKSSRDFLYGYCKTLQTYLELGFVKGQMERSRREQLVNLLEELVLMQSNKEINQMLVTQLFALERYEEARKVIDKMFALWPTDEDIWILKMEYCLRIKDQDQLNQLLIDSVRENIYFGEENRERIEFWRKK